jgi:hypothetical protein
MEVTLERLEQSIKKVTDLIDVNLDNLNQEFLVDNFSPHNNLKSTKLRQEFNQLCKNKAESKNMEEKTLSMESKKIYLCRDNQVRDVPPILCPIFKNPKKLYLMGVPGKNSFIYSVLNIMETDFLLKGPIQKGKSLDEFRNTIVYNLDDIYKKNNYKKKRYNKGTLRENILSSKVMLPQTINMISDYFEACLVIIDTETHLYSLGNDFRSGGKYIVMLRKNSYYQPILSTDGNHYFDEDILNELEKILKPEVEIVKSTNVEIVKSSPTVEIVKSTNVEIVKSTNVEIVKSTNVEIVKSTPNSSTSPEILEIPKELKREKDYKISELQKIACLLNISIVDGVGKKKKLKKAIYEEIKDKFPHKV